MGKINERISKYYQIFALLLFLFIIGFVVVIVNMPAPYNPPMIAKPITSQTPTLFVKEKVNNDNILLNGYVIDETGKPFSEASISTLIPSKEQEYKSSVTDEFGCFNFSLPAGSYILTTTNPKAIVSVSKTIEILKKSEEPVVVELPKSRSLEGKVVNSKGEPVPEAEIAIHAFLEKNQILVKTVPPDISNIQYKQKSKLDGGFNFDRIWPGSYYVVANASEYLQHQDSRISSEKENYVIVLQKSASLHVSVVDENKNSIPFADVNLTSADSNKLIAKRNKVDMYGKCIFNELPLGTYRLEAIHQDFLPNDQSSLTIAVQSDKTYVTLVLSKKGYYASGKVINTLDNKPVPNFALGIVHDDEFISQPFIQVATSDISGQFKFCDLPPDTYRITTRQKGASSLNNQSKFLTVQNFNQGLYGIRIAVIDKNLENIEYRVAPFATISGHVYDKTNKPVSGADVQNNFYNLVSIKSGPDGSYSLSNMPLNKQTDIMSVIIRASHPEYGFGEVDRRIPYKPGEVISGIDIHVDQDYLIFGSVKGASNEALTNAKIRYFDYARVEDLPVNENGEYQIPHAAKTSFIKASCNGYFFQRKKVIAQNRNTEQNFVLEKEDEAKAIRGTVVDQDYKPIAKVTVVCDSDENPLSWETQTNEEGQFDFTVPSNEKIHYNLSAFTTEKPYLKKDSQNIVPGTTDVLIVFEQQVELKIQLMIPEELQPKKEIQSFLTICRTEGWEKNLEDYLVSYVNGNTSHERITLSVFETYNISASKEIAEGILYGAKSFEITRDDMPKITVTIPLTLKKKDEIFFVIARCVDDKGNTVTGEYKIFSRLLDSSKSTFFMERTVHSLPSPLAGFVTYLLHENGNYEFLYVKNDKIFQRTIVYLSSEQGALWDSPYAPTGIKGFSLPDVLLND